MTFVVVTRLQLNFQSSKNGIGCTVVVAVGRFSVDRCGQSVPASGHLDVQEGLLSVANLMLGAVC